MITQDNIKHIFHGDIVGSEIIFYDSTTSTNDRATEVGRTREHPEGIVVIADSQSKGRGRLGREWISPPGVNLYFSVILQPPFSIEESTVFSLASAVASINAIRGQTGLKAYVKWPNDIMLNGKKTGGILIEHKSGPGKTGMLIIGAGINVNMSPDDIPEGLRSDATSLIIENGAKINRKELFIRLLYEMESVYKSLITGDRVKLINDWSGSVSTIGKEISAEVNGRTITGTAEGVTLSGGLLVRLPEGETQVISAGDVTILK